MTSLTALELCAGGGGQALGLEQAGFEHIGLVEIDKHACATLRMNRPHWNIVDADLHEFDGTPYRQVDLLAGGLPCPPFSIAGKQLGRDDERNLFPVALRLVDEIQPRAIMIENVPGLLNAAFRDYRDDLDAQLYQRGYKPRWTLLNAADFGVSQLRPRVLLIAVHQEFAMRFSEPFPCGHLPPTVGQVLYDLMASRGWKGAEAWSKRANAVAPTLVGGSLKHGGPDLGPTRARKEWKALGIDGLGLANEPPNADFPEDGNPRLTVRMTARLQGFPDSWQFAGGKTAAYRQIGNAFPPPVAKELGAQLYQCLTTAQLVHAAG